MSSNHLTRITVLARLALAAATLIGTSATLVDARPLTPAEQRLIPYADNLSPCEDPGALGAIQSRFRDRESEYWHSGLEIVAFDKVDEIGFRSNGLDYIPRRYCVARAVMNDQKLRTVSYSIGKATGSIGFTDGVDFCVSGLDRGDAFAPNCKMARP
jgi:hypothetical protein